MGQGIGSGNDLRVWASLSSVKMKVEVLEDQLFSIDSQQSRDIKTQPSKCQATDVKLSRILNNVDKL